MNIAFSPKNPLSIDLDLLAICIQSSPENDRLFKDLDKSLDGALSRQAGLEGFKSKSGQAMLSHTHGQLSAKSILWIGAGEKSKNSLAKTKNLASVASAKARSLSAKSIGFVALTSKPQDLGFAAEGAILGSYRFTKYLRGSAASEHPTQEFTILCHRGAKSKLTASQTRAAKAAVSRGISVANATCHARDMVNEPAEAMDPAAMVKEAKALAKKHKSLKVKVLSATECEKLGMGMFLAVGRGSDKESKFIHLTYTPTKKPKKRVALVGKGVTFDAGGYSLKPSSSMMGMKVDMAGSAAVVASMGAIAEIGSPYEVHAVTALCENLVNGRAYKLGDVLRAMDGTTVEINNTDAEGRLTLGDALIYTRTKIEPDEIFDFATLTGACMVALGPHTAGVMSDHNKLANKWLKACDSAGEDVWRMPLNPKLKKQLKSPIADMRNTGERYGGALTAGLFLKHFAGDVPWVHTDIAGPSNATSSQGAIKKGGTGFGVASIVQYLCE